MSIAAVIPALPKSDDDGCYSLEQIGQSYGLCHESVRKIEKVALTKARYLMRIEHLVGRGEYLALLSRHLRGKPVAEYKAAFEGLLAVAREPDELEAISLWLHGRPRLDGLVVAPDNGNGERP